LGCRADFFLKCSLGQECADFVAKLVDGFRER
jgi:hypothetical protein